MRSTRNNKTEIPSKFLPVSVIVSIAPRASGTRELIHSPTYTRGQQFAGPLSDALLPERAFGKNPQLETLHQQLPRLIKKIINKNFNKKKKSRKGNKKYKRNKNSCSDIDRNSGAETGQSDEEFQEPAV